jgi:hypothetical protein
MSCSSAGNCSAGGTETTDTSGNSQGIVVNEVKGVWEPAQLVPLLVSLNTDGFAGVNAVACGGVGECSAVGYYTKVTRQFIVTEAFIANEVKGAWRKAQEIPVGPQFNGAGAGLSAVSCPSVGYCSAAGGMTNLAGQDVGIVVNELRGTWQPPEEVSGVARDYLSDISCASRGRCAAVGTFYLGVGMATTRQGFVANELGGRLQAGGEVPGLGALNTAGAASATLVSCARSGYCVAVGSYAGGAVGSPPDESGPTQPFLTATTI